MMDSVNKRLLQLIEKVEQARNSFIEACTGLTHEQSKYIVEEGAWSITDIAEHIVRAEWGGLNGIWTAMEGYKNNRPVWSGENANQGLKIEEIVEKTWLQHQPAPEAARPQWGGALEFWLEYLRNGKTILSETARQLEGSDPEKIIYPHPISGPLNVYQRMEFLRYHMERHQRQVENIKMHLKDNPVWKLN